MECFAVHSFFGNLLQQDHFCPNHLCLLCQIVCDMLFSSFIFSRTDIFVTLFFQLIIAFFSKSKLRRNSRGTYVSHEISVDGFTISVLDKVEVFALSSCLSAYCCIINHEIDLCMMPLTANGGLESRGNSVQVGDWSPCLLWQSGHVAVC